MIRVVPFELSPVECRVLGCLIEKDLSTPEYYPLSLNALVNACNQKSNRDPVVQWDESTVRGGLDALIDIGLALEDSEMGSRVEKFRHQLSDVFNLSKGELAILAELLLRGPQTGGEIRNRSSRMHTFFDLETAELTLEKMSARQPEPLTLRLPQQPGRKESRWAHLLSGVPSITSEPQAPSADARPALQARVEALEVEVNALRRELDELKASLGA
jgi:uncharacterized protein YceH (UPF0502 family)